MDGLVYILFLLLAVWYSLREAELHEARKENKRLSQELQSARLAVQSPSVAVKPYPRPHLVDVSKAAADKPTHIHGSAHLDNGRLTKGC